jgi:hypothetical protein
MGEGESRVEISAISPEDISPLKTISGFAGPSPSQFYVFAPPGVARAAPRNMPRCLAI